MKMYVYIWLVLLGILTIRCSSDDIGNPEEDSPEYDSYWYYSYEAAQLVNAETLGMEALEDFSPYTVAHLGDTLFIANIGKEGNSLLVFNTKEGRLLDVVKSWQFDNEERISGVRSKLLFRQEIDYMLLSGSRAFMCSNYRI